MTNLLKLFIRFKRKVIEIIYQDTGNLEYLFTCTSIRFVVETFATDRPALRLTFSRIVTFSKNDTFSRVNEK